jgi:DNA-binding IclR family transcriptional regulator
MYDLGPASRDLGLEALRRVDPARIAAAYSVDLRNETGHTAEVAVWSSAGPILIAWDPGAHELPVLVRVGSTLPLLDSAVGSVFLAYLPESMTSEALVQQQQRGATRRISAREAKKIGWFSDWPHWRPLCSTPIADSSVYSASTSRRG